MFNAAHLHIAVNHLPVIGFLAALVFALLCLFSTSRTLHLVAMGTAVVSALGAVAAYLTGEPAEEMINDMDLSGISTAHLLAHERIGTYTYYAGIVVGVIALVLFIATLRRTEGSRALALLMLSLCVAATGMGGLTATLGGDVRHSEIQSDEVTRMIEDKVLNADEKDVLNDERGSSPPEGAASKEDGTSNDAGSEAKDPGVDYD